MRSSSRVGNILAVLVLADADPVFGTLASSVDDHVSVLMTVYSSAHLKLMAVAPNPDRALLIGHQKFSIHSSLRE